MNPRRSPFAGVTLRLPFYLIAVLVTFSVSTSAVDLNKDGLSDIWALYHAAEAQAPNADPDGDGLTNAQEAAAGTDPQSPTSIIRVSSMALNAGGLRLTFPTLAGKRYQVQSAASLVDPTWGNVGPAVAGTDGEITTTSSAAGVTQKFYRVLVQDVDSDGDGVNDWEELTLGYDPNNSRSSGIEGDDDLTTITKALQAPNVITIAASEPNAAEPGPLNTGSKPGVFQISRTGNL
ncbi:MAG: hypothetical protein EOP84_28405, partial [Verrucomicrobiaceae bacterium]